MNDQFMYLVVGIIVVVIVVVMWNNQHENLYIPPLAPNQVYQGNYTNPMTTPNPRDWSCPSGTTSPYCCPEGNKGLLCNETQGRHGEYPLGMGENFPLEGYQYGGRKPVSSGEPIDIIAPPFTEEVWALGFGMGEGIYLSGRQTSQMVGN